MKRLAKIFFFISSYLPLFLIMLINSTGKNQYNFKHFDWFHVKNFVNHDINTKFCLILCAISCLSCLISIWVLKDYENKAMNNRKIINIVKVENKNNENLAYIATYLIPFISQDFKNYFDIVSFSLLLIVIAYIYLDSNMFLINPMLKICGYSINNISYNTTENAEIKDVMIISKIKKINANQGANIFHIEDKLFYLNKGD